MTEIASSTPVPGHRSAEPAALALAVALRRARWTIFWERLWPALATLATAAGLFLTASWLGLWLWLPPLGRAAAVLAFAIIALAAAIPFIFVRVPAVADGLRRLDHGSGLRHRPATALVDALAVTPSDSYSLTLWNAHVGRMLAAARTFKAAGRRPASPRAIPTRCAASSSSSASPRSSPPAANASYRIEDDYGATEARGRERTPRGVSVQLSG